MDHPEFSLENVANQIGKSLSAVERAVAKLAKNGQLRRVGPSKGGYCPVNFKIRVNDGISPAMTGGCVITSPNSKS